jgi:zinc D-Ala-D-Ala dipeptidase
MVERYTSVERYEVDPELLLPIPLEVPSAAGWKEIHLEPTESDALVPMGLFAPEFNDIPTSSIYFGERDDSPYRSGELKGAESTIFVRRSVAERIRQAQALLPANLKIVVFDAYRPLEVQQALYDKYYKELQALQSGWTPEHCSIETQKFVAVPSTDQARPSPHNTGGAVDLAIIKISDNTVQALAQMDAELPDSESGKKLWQLVQIGREIPYYYSKDTLPEEILAWVSVQLERERYFFRDRSSTLLNFGTPFDYGTPDSKAEPNYFELLQTKRFLTPDEIEARNNRRILYNVMRKVGMQPRESEWWHFNAPESQMGAKAAGLSVATYGATTISGENRRFADAKNRFYYRNFFTQRISYLPRAAVIKPAA